jgi:hypothetical protein
VPEPVVTEVAPDMYRVSVFLAYVGDGERALQELNGVLREIFGEP